MLGDFQFRGLDHESRVFYKMGTFLLMGISVC